MTTPTAASKEKFKVVLLGEGCVGKTSLVLRYVQDVFRENHVATVQASFLQKRISLQGQRIELNIWDTAGQETYHALGPIYYRDAHGALLVYDITDEDSYLRIQEWIKELRSVLGPIPMVLAGNKSDLDTASGTAPRSSRSTNERQRVVTMEDVQRYAQELNQKMPGIARDTGDTLEMVTFVETSAKLNRNVDLAFVELAKRMQAIRNSQQLPHSPTHGSHPARSGSSPLKAGASPTRRSLVILDDPRRNQPSSPMRSSHSRLASSSSTGDERSCCVIS